MTSQIQKHHYKDQISTVVSGLGSVTPAGVGVAALWESVLNQKSHLSVDARGFCLGAIPADITNELRAKWGDSRSYQNISKIYPDYQHFNGTLYSIEAVSQAVLQAGWDGFNEDDGFILATTTGQIPVWEQPLMTYLRDPATLKDFAQAFKHQPLALLMNQIVEAFNIRGPTHLVTSACAASTQALALANLWIKTGKVRRCLVGGTELLCDLTVRGFDCFQLLSSEEAKPFDRSRKGINLSEAAAFVCLEAASSKSNALCTLAGGGISADAYHMTSPEPTGRGCVSAMQKALKSAGLEAHHIDWVYAHGTGSQHNDSSESAAIFTLFGETPVTSTKGVHGHALAASGVVEAILAVKAIEKNTMLPTVNFSDPGDDIRVNVLKEAKSKKIKHVVKNTLGFGGSNGCVIFSALGGGV